MLTTLTSGQTDLQPGAMLHFINHDRQRLSFTAASGFLWLTRDGDIRDYVLRGGDAITLCPGDDVWLTLEDAKEKGTLTLEPVDAPRPAWKRAAALFSTFPTHPCHAFAERSTS
nr:DUF2917 domain-containing protein [uncultured Noviherbaspirillum sp.]